MVVEPFNAVWFGFLGTMALLGVGLHLALRHRPRKIQVRVCVTLAAANVVLYTLYTFKSILNPGMPEVVFWQNLPFHFCNIVAWGLIPAYLFEMPRLRTLCYFPGALAGLLTLTSPVIVYIGHPLWSLESIGFYGVHSVNVILGTLLGSLGFFKPTVLGAIKSVGYLFALIVVIFPLDAIMRATVDPNVNYFYLFNPEDADILEMAN
ncbi:MAG: YwaF family protein, partial [Bifidobacteriaceae bacterium]|nr:YwaF family protein [Bifidobacteriaceae bacterium]